MLSTLMTCSAPSSMMVSLSHSRMLFTQASSWSCSLIRSLVLQSCSRFDSFII